MIQRLLHKPYLYDRSLEQTYIMAENINVFRSCYSAANVTVIRSVATRDPHHVYLAKITQFWALDDHNCSQFENHTLIVIRTSYSHCEACPDFNTTAGHNVYLVGGYCNNKGWYLPNTNSLVSPWHPHRVKYESKLQTWIQNAIEWRS